MVEREFALQLSRACVAAGEVTVEAANYGEDPHNLYLRREGSSDPPLVIEQAEPGEVKEATFTLGAGSWHLWCDLPGHEEAGMAATLRVE